MNTNEDDRLVNLVTRIMDAVLMSAVVFIVTLFVLAIVIPRALLFVVELMF